MGESLAALPPLRTAPLACLAAGASQAGGELLPRAPARAEAAAALQRERLNGFGDMRLSVGHLATHARVWCTVASRSCMCLV